MTVFRPTCCPLRGLYGFRHAKITFFRDPVHELWSPNEKFENTKSCRKDRSWKICYSFHIVLHLTAPRGRVLKKCSDHYLKNQYSDFDVHTIERIFGIRSKEVVGENLIEGRIKKLWPKMSFFPWFFPDGVQWKLDILRQNNFHKKSNTTFGLEGLHLVVKASNLIFVQSRLR